MMHNLAQRFQSSNVKKSPWSRTNFLLQGLSLAFLKTSSACTLNSTRGVHQLPPQAILPLHISPDTCLLLTLTTGLAIPNTPLECCVSDTKMWRGNKKVHASWRTAASEQSQQVWTEQTRAWGERAAAVWLSRKWPEVSHDLLHL